MLGKKISSKCLILCAVVGLLNSAATCSYKVRNVEWCSVAGVMAAGMDCAETQTDRTRSMNLEETIEFLEPQDGKNPRAGAMCTSAENFNKQKTDLDVLCQKLGDACTDEVKEYITKASARMDGLQVKTTAKKTKKKN